MPEIYGVLSNDKKIISFEGGTIRNANAKIGITTTAFGDARTDALLKNSYAKLSLLKKLTGANNAALMKPKHENKTITCQPAGDDLYEYDSILACKDGGRAMTLLGMPLGDCPGIWIFSPNFYGIVHSGWQGTLDKVVPNALKAFFFFNTEPKDIFAIIWPGHCPNCYAVGPEFNDYFPGRVNNGCLDLSRVIEDQLLDAGIPIDNIHTIRGLYTRCIKSNSRPLFYSHRRREKERVLAYMTI